MPLLVALTLLFVASAAQASERLVPVSTANELRNALAGALDGDVIELADGIYAPGGTPFTILGSESASFTLRAASPGMAVIDGGSGACGSRSRLFDHRGTGWVTFDGLVFRDGCTTESGRTGGVDLRNGARATFVDTQFLANEARIFPLASGSSAGALLITDQSQAQFIRCTFTGNTGDNHGGAALIGQGSRVFIHDSTFTANRNNVENHRNNGLGGAIHVFNGLQGTTTELYVTNSRFADNEAAYVGGAIMAKGNFVSGSQPVASPSRLVIANSTFVGNVTAPLPGLDHPSAPPEGGAIMIENNVTLEIYHSRFEDSLSVLGGAIAAYRGEVLIRDSVFRNNRAFDDTASPSDGQGGAIRIHSNEGCSESNRNATLEIHDSAFIANTAQWGGAINAAGDVLQQYSCGGSPSVLTNRAPLTIQRSVFADNSVDNDLGDNALGGAIYSELVTATIADSLFIGNQALDSAAADKTIAGGAAAFRRDSAVGVADSTFAENSSDKEGGALHVFGGEVDLDGNRFFANVVPGVTPSASRGAAVYLGPDGGSASDLTGSVVDSSFSDNSGLAIWERDDATTGARHNRVVYETNVFHETTFGDDVFYNHAEKTSQTVAGLNALVVSHGADPATDKSPGDSNVESGASLDLATLRVAPPVLLTNGAAGDAAGSPEVFVAYAWNGGCAELDGAMLDPVFEVSGFVTATAPGARLLEVWSGACDAGAADASAAETVVQLPSPSASLDASPLEISSGQSSSLSWSVVDGTFVAGVVTHGVDDLMTSASGNAVVTPPATTRYRVLGVAEEGGAIDVQGVFVDQEPDIEGLLFIDGFESGDTSRWSAAVN